MNIKSFAGKSPRLTLEAFFQGNSRGSGVVENRFGGWQRQFTIAASGSWNATTRTLDLSETYTFDDGQIDCLQWRIQRLAGEYYEGREPTLVGAARGEQSGNAFHWAYSRRVPAKDGSETSISFDDWFWLQQDGTLVARAFLNRFGFQIATMSVFYRTS